MMEHHFNTSVAAEVESIEKAVILYNIDFWITKNRANKKHFIDGSTWTYNSVSAFNKLFPYMKEKTINRCLKQLEMDGYLVSKKLSEDKRDRTKWYALTERYYCICSNEQMDMLERANVYKEQIVNTDTNVETKKVSTSVTFSIDSNNERVLRHLPKTVRGKKVNEIEKKKVIEYYVKFNIVRNNYFEANGVFKGKVTPSNKALKQFIDIIRDGYMVDDIIDAAYNAYEDKFHKENNYRYITMEYIVRDEIWQRYRDESDKGNN